MKKCINRKKEYKKEKKKRIVNVTTSGRNRDRTGWTGGLWKGKQLLELQWVLSSIHCQHCTLGTNEATLAWEIGLTLKTF